MKMKIGLVILAAVMAILFAGSFVSAAEMEERSEIYPYSTYDFPRDDGTILRAVSYVVPGKEVAEIGIYGVTVKIFDGLYRQYLATDKKQGVRAYLVSILTHPYPEKNIEAQVLEFDLDMVEIEKDINKNLGRKEI